VELKKKVQFYLQITILKTTKALTCEIFGLFKVKMVQFFFCFFLCFRKCQKLESWGSEKRWFV